MALAAEVTFIQSMSIVLNGRVNDDARVESQMSNCSAGSSGVP